MINLPYSDELNIGYLSRLFDDTTNCYKFFWFQAILRKVDAGYQQFTFSDLIDEMICDAWYMVTECHLRLEPLNTKDNLEEVVKCIHKKYGTCFFENREKRLAFIRTIDDKEVRDHKYVLTQQVPYRLQAPFFEKPIPPKVWHGSKRVLAEKINTQNRLIYYFSFISGLGTIVEVNHLWMEYLKKHKDILMGWTQLKLIQYLQRRNPSVPGIADKIEPPASRDIARVRKYWKLIASIDPSLKDIYGELELADMNISIDHFVPWQYVAHDELWNLHPTTKGINSSKSNSLPAWSQYFEPLGDLEFRAYELRAECKAVALEFDEIAKYHLNNPEIKNQLYAGGLDRTAFKERLENVIRPVYESAKLQGFKEWSYHEQND